MAKRRVKRGGLQVDDIHRLLDSIFGQDLHAKRVYSLANATLGVIAGASLAINMIGQALAQARGLVRKHAIKQVDRLLSNRGIDVWSLFVHWVPYVVGASKAIVVAMDWTEFDRDGHSTLMLSLVTRHGRATPLVWKTVEKATLEGRRNGYEDEVLARLAEVLPAEVAVTVLADRGFGDVALYHLLEHAIGFDYLIRFRGNILVTDAKGTCKAAAAWLGPSGRARVFRQAGVTGSHYRVPTVVCVQDRGMAEPWCLAASDPQATARQLIGLYAKRWTIEPAFRDTKDLRFGMGMSRIRVTDPQRRDRLWLMNALAVVLLTLLGAAGETLGFDRHLKANTVKRRTHSLFTQGCLHYDLLPNMPEQRLRPLMERFGELLCEHRTFTDIFCFI